METAEQTKENATDPDFRAIAVRADVTNEASVDAMVQSALKKLGRIDFLVNSAGVGTSYVTKLVVLDMLKMQLNRLATNPTYRYQTLTRMYFLEPWRSMSTAACSACEQSLESCPNRNRGPMRVAAGAQGLWLVDRLLIWGR